MNPSAGSSCPPGTLFLRIARLLFAEQTISRVFLPAVADFQNELREASTSRLTHLVARCRWYWALPALLVVTPFSVSIRSIGDQSSSHAASGGWLFTLLYVAMFVGAWSCVQEFMTAAIVAGVVLAWLMRAWNDRHPAVLSILGRETSRDCGKAFSASRPLIANSISMR
jgi:hypothetical protein